MHGEEQLLQEDGSDVSCMTTDFSKGMHLNQALVPMDSLVGVRRFNHFSSTSSNILMQRPNLPIQAFSRGEVGNPPSAQDLHGVYSCPVTKPSHFMPHNPQNSPSHVRQQSVQQFNHGRSTAVRGNEWNHIKVQPSPSSFNSGGHFPGNSSFGNGKSWGHRGNHPITNTPPTSRGRKDY
ncbi:hypothetical protein F0562_026848 [Nyssa sinensis]|uniref:Uncharacterized protein n=1 Tax=Nyssa sinensis TaxID=561372 RepID=A0A5J5BCE7_9ASTE|nr:hypothetical protein F0562_026848 [Nyssa sinensis]